MGKKTSSIKLPDTMRIGEAAHILHRTTMTLRRWDEAGLLKPHRVGRRKDRHYTKQQILNVLEHGIKKGS